MTSKCYERDVFTEALRKSFTAVRSARPNPWVGAALAFGSEVVSVGATEGPGGRHAEIVAFDEALSNGVSPKGATLYVTLEPCAHFGRTPPCTSRIVKEGVEEVVIGTLDPDPKVRGLGVQALLEAGVAVKVLKDSYEVIFGLRPYIKQRYQGRPWVVLKLAITLDGKVAARDGSSKWITGVEARRDAHLIRERSEAIVVGANTVRLDNPSLRARNAADEDLVFQPRRIVLGDIPDDAKVLPAESYKGDLEVLLRRLGTEEVMQVLFEGGPSVAYSLHAEGLVDEYVFYIAPALGLGGAIDAFSGGEGRTVADFWRSSYEMVKQLGDDIKVTLLADSSRKMLLDHLSFSLSTVEKLGGKLC
jgi:diaminohydroxyphosphoribosylaminopyrimidine deaminase/5-amino-6-(5-phosphoribosylamino)uracil reductase